MDNKTLPHTVDLLKCNIIKCREMYQDIKTIDMFSIKFYFNLNGVLSHDSAL